MERFTEWIQMRSDVLKYISDNSGKIDGADIRHHFRPLGDIALKRATELCDIGKVRRARYGSKYVYEAI